MLRVEAVMPIATRLLTDRMSGHAAWREPQQFECDLARWQSAGQGRGWPAGPGPAPGTARPPASARVASTCLWNGPFSIRHLRKLVSGRSFGVVQLDGSQYTDVAEPGGSDYTNVVQLDSNDYAEVR